MPPAQAQFIEDDDNRTALEDERAVGLAKDQAKASRAQKTVADHSKDSALAAQSYLQDLEKGLPPVKSDLSNEEGTHTAELNRTPSTDYLPLVGEGGPVGLSAAYAGSSYGAPGISDSQWDVSDEAAGAEEDAAQRQAQEDEEAAGPERLGGVRGAVNNKLEGVMGMINQPKIDALQQQIDALEAQREQVRADIAQRILPLQKRIDALAEQKKKYKEATIDKLNSWWRRLAMKCWDFGRACEFLMAAWWWTIIGVIIDILCTWPLLLLFYLIGIIKGKHIRDLNAKVKKHEQAMAVMTEEQRRFRQTILVYQGQLGQFEQDTQARIEALEREQFQLTQVFKGPNRAGPAPLGLAT